MISVITPSFRNSNWLKICIASVADQKVQCEHIVQDACSDDGTHDWLPKDTRVKAFIEKDMGMYDGVNRGLRRAKGEILSYLNCDEQYLPGTLAAVETFFEENPEIDVLFGDFIVVDSEGTYRFHRKVQTPLLYHTWVSHLPTFTCATFFRRHIITEQKYFFDGRLTDAGDAEWMLRLLRHQVPMAVLRRFTSAFTLTGTNMSGTLKARREGVALANSAPILARRAKPLLVLHHRLRRLFGGIYFQKPFSYSIYTQMSPEKRVTHQVMRPTAIWNAKNSI